MKRIDREPSRFPIWHLGKPKFDGNDEEEIEMNRFAKLKNGR